MRKGVLVGDVLWQIMNGLIATGAHVGYIKNGANTIDLIKRRHQNEYNQTNHLGILLDITNYSIFGLGT